jgi:hypothetical protein
MVSGLTMTPCQTRVYQFIERHDPWRRFGERQQQVERQL